MKTLYITTFILVGIVSLKAQENKTYQLASEQGLEIEEQNSVQPKSTPNVGKLIPNSASFEEILASIPNRKVNRNTNPKPVNSVKGLPNIATFEEIKKTIPKN